MATTCKKCGATTSGDQAFCPKCGAVIGMEGTPGGDTPPNLGATIVGQRFNIPPPPKPATTPPPPKPAETPPRWTPTAEPPTAPPAGARIWETTNPAPRRDSVIQPLQAPATGGGGRDKMSLLAVLTFFVVLVGGGLLLWILYYLFF